MTVTLTVAEGYEYDNKHPGYGFTVDVYNKCGKGDSITFEEALEHIDGRSLLRMVKSGQYSPFHTHSNNKVSGL